MGVVVLHGDAPHGRLRERPLRREVIGVEVVDDDLRFDAQQLLQVADGVAEEGKGFGIVELADMLTEKDLAPPGQGDGVLQFATDREQGFGERAGEQDRLGDVAAAPAHDHGRPGGHTDDGVVAALQDFAIMQQKGVGNPAQARQGLLIADGDRFLAEVAAGHDQHGQGPGQEQMVEGGVGEHEAVILLPGGDGPGEGARPDCAAG